MLCVTSWDQLNELIFKLCGFLKFHGFYYEDWRLKMYISIFWLVWSHRMWIKSKCSKRRSKRGGMQETQRRSCGAWRCFCTSWGSGGHFAGLVAALHPLPPLSGFIRFRSWPTLPLILRGYQIFRQFWSYNGVNNKWESGKFLNICQFIKYAELAQTSF